MDVVSDVTLQSIAAIERISRREKLSEAIPEKSTVTENKEVNKAPERSPYLPESKPGMSIDIM